MSDRGWTVHYALNSKGGVGKSFLTSIVAQYYKLRGEPFRCFDADATTATLSRFKALNVTRLELMDGLILNTRKFDEILEAMLTQNAHFLVDTGTSSFVAVSHYIVENDVHEQILQIGKTVYVHVVIIGGQTLTETLNDLDTLARQLSPDVKLVVWLNEHFGAIRTPDGRSFTEMEVYQKHQGRIAGIIHLPQRTAATFGEDIKQMMASSLTFDEAIAAPEFSLMARQRLKLMRDNVIKKLEATL